MPALFRCEAHGVYWDPADDEEPTICPVAVAVEKALRRIGEPSEVKPQGVSVWSGGMG